MSAIITGRVFWTEFKDLAYQDKKKQQVNIKETTAKIVMLAIANSADDYGENSWQSFETIAQKASIERRSAIRVVRALIEHRYLSIAGITKYGTNNFTINKDLLGFPPAKRAKVGRPKTSDRETKIGDSETKIGDSETLIGDSGAKTSDPESPYPSYIHPESIHITEEERVILEKMETLRGLYEANVGPITTLIMDGFRKAVIEYPDPSWYKPAFDVMVENADHRSWTYVDRVLKNWKDHYFGWTPGDRGNGARKNGSKPVVENRDKYITGKYSEFIR